MVLDGLCYLAGADAARADQGLPLAAVVRNADALKVGLVDPLRLVIRVAYVVADLLALTAYLAYPRQGAPPKLFIALKEPV